MHEARAGHRLDNPTHRLAVTGDLADEVAQTITVRWRRELLDELARIGDHAHIEPPATEIKTSMQHQTLPSERLTGTAERPVTVRRGRRLLFEWPARAAGIRARLHRCSTQSAGPLRPQTPKRPEPGSFIAFLSSSEAEQPAVRLSTA